MDNKSKAVLETLGYSLSNDLAKKLFNDVYAYILYNDTDIFLEVLDFRMNIQETTTCAEDYHFFKFMLQKMLEKHPSRLVTLNPLSDNIAA
ncbi:hypothetical protein [Pontibacter ruber]|uniref:Uncharacterized protein n=1 Tax=Pontibacter ruber TaxID=1343895 RepID=A0ABW5D0C0_9BACT|nr:hypothetical protein [Pontibacter ruber]